MNTSRGPPGSPSGGALPGRRPIQDAPDQPVDHVGAMIREEILPDQRDALIFDQARLIAQPVYFHYVHSQSLNQLVHRFPATCPCCSTASPPYRKYGTPGQ